MKQTTQPGKHSYVFNLYLEPITIVQSGEELVIYSRDALEDRLHAADQKPTEVLGDYLNPRTGPVYTE